MFLSIISEALELNQQIQQVQQESSTEMFQLPPGVISESSTEERTHIPMEEENSSPTAGQTQTQSEYSEMLNVQSENQQYNYQNTADTASYMTPNSENLEGSENNPVPVTADSSQTGTHSDNFSFQSSSLGAPNTSYSDSIVSQFLANMTEALQSQEQEPKHSSSGNFSTNLSTYSTYSTQSYNQSTVSTEATNIPRSSCGYSFDNDIASSMEFSVNLSPVKQSRGSQPAQPERSLKDMLSTTHILDHLHFNFEKDCFSPEQVVPDSSIQHLSTDTLLSTSEVCTLHAYYTCCSQFSLY